MSQQQQAQAVPPEHNVTADHLSQRKSSYASTDIPIDTTANPGVETMAQQRYPVDDINQRTPFDLQSVVKNLTFTIAYGTAMPTQPGDVYHGQQIPARYARVSMEQVCV